MVLSYEQVCELLDEIAEEFPPELFQQLNGGVNVLEEARTKPEFPEDQMYIMGQYFSGPLGRFVNLYYGSFEAAARKEFWDAAEWREELRKTLAHELTHHLESLGGLHGLEDQDDEDMARYRQQFGMEP